MRSCLGNDSSRIESLLNSAAPQLAELLPEIGQARRSALLAPLLAVPSSDPEGARFRLFDSLALLLRGITDAEPLLIILDDLHEADQPSLLMLRFIARQVKECRLLLIGSYREIEVRNSPVLSRLIGEIAREGHEILLGGLSDSEVAAWVEADGGVDVSAALISALIRTTGGNPLFVDGILRILTAEQAGRPLQTNGLIAHQLTSHYLHLPAGVRETIRRRRSFLSKEANEILSIAAVIGQEFEFECLRRIAEVNATALINALNEARRDGLIHPVLAGGVSYRFAHDLIRETIYDDLPVPAESRLNLHLKAGGALEALHGSNPTRHVAELAHHYRESVTVGDPAKAIDYSIRAGEQALAIFAYEEVTAHWRAALALMECYEANSVRHAELLRKIGVVTCNTVNRVEGIKYLEASLNLCTRLRDSGMAAVAHNRAGICTGRLDRIRPPHQYPPIFGAPRECGSACGC